MTIGTLIKLTRVKSTLLSLILLVCTVSLYAQEQTLPQGEAWSLQACIDYAVQHSRQMEAKQAANRKQDLNLRDARLSLLPEVSGGSNAGYNFGRSPDPATNAYSNTQYFGNSYSLTASMPLFEGLSGINQMRYEKFGQLKGQKEAEKLANDIAVEILQMYYEALYRQGLLELAQEQVKLSTQELERMQRQADLGLKAKADIADADAKLATDLYNRINCQNTYEDAMLLLKRRMSYPLDEPLALRTAPDELRDYAAAPLQPDSLFALALDRLPQTKASELNLKQVRAALLAQRGLLFPRLYLGGGYNTGYYNSSKDDNGVVIPFNTQFSNNASEYVRLTLQIPIFTGLVRHSNTHRAKQDLRIAQAGHEDLLQDVYKEVHKSVQDLNASIQAYHQALKQEQAREIAYKVNQKKYNEGLISILDLHTSANLLLAAKAETIGNYMKMNAKRRIVAYFEGTPLVSPM